MAWMESERKAMVRTLHAADPQAPTLCEGWNVSRLLAHLIMREERPWAMVGDGIRRDKPGQEHSLNGLVALEGEERELRRRLPLMARMSYLRSPVGVTLQLPGGEQARVRRGEPAVTITGPVAELALHAMGRRSAARVDISGAPESVDRFRSFTGA